VCVAAQADGFLIFFDDETEVEISPEWPGNPRLFAIKSRQILFGSRLNGILASQDVTASQPIECVCVVIWMSAVDGHAPTLARVFLCKSHAQNQA
jgi:hypothetical protein